MNKKIECIKRLLLLSSGQYYEFANWLMEHKLADEGDFESVSRIQERAELIYEKLRNAEVNSKLMLLDYEWTILPLETIRITCVTTVEKREFTHGL